MSRETKFLFEMDAAADDVDVAIEEDEKQRAHSGRVADSIYVNLRLCILERRIPLLQKMRPKHTKILLDTLYN